MDLASKLFKGDRVIWIIFMLLCLVSVVEVFSATSTLAYKNANHWTPIVRHTSFLLGGFVAVLLIHNVPYKYLSAIILLLPISAVFLVLALLFGESINGASRWLSFMGIPFQPSEFAKLSAVVFVAFLLSKRPALSDGQVFKWILIGVSSVCLLILPENFSTAILLFGVCFLMMFIGQMPIKMLLKLSGVLILLLTLFIGVLVLTPKSVVNYLPDRAVTWKGRIDDFIHRQGAAPGPDYVINDDNYQVSHAKIAIASGGIFGKMPGHGQQRDFLPQAYSDFIYAIIIEELGVVGGFAVLLLYIMLLVRVGMIARRCDKPFAKYLVLGCGLLIVVQALANIAVAVNLIPVTGQPLPLISRGGTSTMLSCVYIGIILSVSRFSAGMGEDEYEDEINEDEHVEETISDKKEVSSPLGSLV